MYAFDGCMDVVKLPMPSYSAISIVDVVVVGEKVYGVCEEDYLIEWEMGEDRGLDTCRVSTFVGNGFRTKERVEIIGRVGDGVVLKCKGEEPVRDGGDCFTPYKRTEYGQRLIEKARKSVKISASKIELLKNSIDASPLVVQYRKYNVKACEKLVYGINLAVKRAFLGVLVDSSSKVVERRYAGGGLPVILHKKIIGFLQKQTRKAMIKLKLNVENAKLTEELRKIALGNLFKLVEKTLQYLSIKEIEYYITYKVIETAIACIEIAEKRSLSTTMANLNENTKIWKFVDFLANIRKRQRKSIFESIKILFHNEKGLAKLKNTLRLNFNKALLRSFHLMAYHSESITIKKDIANLSISCELNIIKIALSKAQSRYLKSTFRILKDINSCYPLSKLLKRRLKKIFSRCILPRLMPDILKFHRTLINSTLREKLKSFKCMIKSVYHEKEAKEKDIISMLSPIKPSRSNSSRGDAEDQEEIYSHSKTNTIGSSIPGDMPMHKASSTDALDFKKYLMWWKEFKSNNGKKKTEGKKGGTLPPWRPSGANFVKHNDESIKKAYRRRREYSESLRSSKSSFSSEESFCRKIGWDKWEYIKKLKSKKSKDMTKFIATRLIVRVFLNRYSKNWKEFTSQAKKSNLNTLKKLVTKSWKVGVYSIGVMKITALFRKKAINYGWKFLIKY